MDWTQVIFMFLANFTVILWFRAESRADWRMMDANWKVMDSNMKELNQRFYQESKDFHERFYQETKDFHSRLLCLEERSKNKG